MGSGNDAQRAIRFREIVEHPDRITDPVAFLVSNGATIRVKGWPQFDWGWRNGH